MANTFSKIYLHVIFAVKNRDSAIHPIHEKTLHNYIAGIIKNNGHHTVCIGGTSDHIHILISYTNINQPIPELVRNIKSASSSYCNEKRFIKCRFEWQRGYGCFSYSHSQVPAVCQYISQQHEHHNRVSLEQEIRGILDRFEIEYDERYLIREEPR